MNPIILFDGECNFCDRSVQFIIKRDCKKKFKFTSIQSEIGQKFIKNYAIPNNLESVILIEGNRYYTKSTAALRISKKLNGLWKLFYFFIIIPTPIRDIVYNVVAKKRYLFGKKTVCTIPNKEDLDRFL